MRGLLALGVLLSVLAALLAGCATDPVPDTVPEADAARLPLRFASSVALPGGGSGEPNLAILPDGTMFVTAPAGGAEKPNVREGSAYLWRSTDSGATWEALRSPTLDDAGPASGVAPGTFCSCDADVTTSPDGWVYYSDWWITGLGAGPGNYLVEASDDGGATWSVNSVPIPQNILASMDRQWLVAGEDGFVGLFYSFFGPGPLGVGFPVPAFGLDRAGQAIEAVFSTDHGNTWTDPVAVVPASGMGYQIAHPRIARDGTLWMPYGAVEGGNSFWRDPSHVRVAVSTDKGQTWQDRLVADVPEGFDNLWAVQGASDPVTGRNVVVWAGRLDDDNGAVWIATSPDLAAWSAPYTVDGLGINVLPWAAAFNGTVTVGWYGTAATGDPADLPADARWYALAAQWDGSGGAPRAATMPIAYVSTHAVKVGSLCPRGASCGGDRELLDYVSLAYDPAGRVHYAFGASDDGAVTTRVAGQDGFAAQDWPDA